MLRFHLLLPLVGLLLPLHAVQAGWWPSSAKPLQQLERALLFHPTRDTEHWLPPPAGLAVEDVWLQTPQGIRIHAWWLPRPGATGAVLYCHGNAGNLSHRGPTIATMSRVLHESVLIVDYPGYGKSEGQPDEAGCYAAALAGYNWLTRNKQVPAERIILFGKSLGGGVAAELASRLPHRALVLVKTFTSIPDTARENWLTFSSSVLVRNKFDTLAKIGKCRQPLFLAHGDRDEVIPLAQAKELFTAASEPKQFLLLKGAGHNDALPAEFWTGLARFLQDAK